METHPSEGTATPRDDETQRLKDEFDAQRARMKELYLQKEEEVKKAMEEKRALQNDLEITRELFKQLEIDNSSHKSEIESLRQLVQETVEESSNASYAEIKKLQIKCAEYEQQINLLNRQSNASPDKIMMPSALVQAVTKRIARKLGTDPNCQDSLEDSMKKAQEDADVLRSLVVPLEEEIASLKEKLRETDTQLQQANQALESRPKSSRLNDSKDNLLESGCDMCANYEAQLVSEQKKSQDYLERANKSDASLKMALEEIEKEAKLRRDTLGEWNAVRDEVRTQSEALAEKLTQAEFEFANATTEMRNSHTVLLDEITRLTVERETVQEHLNSLQLENERLLGKFSACAQALRTEDIDLPNDIAELQEYALRQREELIIAVMGRERAQESEQTLAVIQRHAEELTAHNSILKGEIREMSKEFERFADERDKINLIKDQARSTHAQLREVQEKKEQLEKKANEYHGRIISLQQDLNTSETVQKDFVKLSQTLQVQLERIRGSDVEVRWQHDEDIDDCSNCRTPFSTSKKKQHCRHCGRIFCNPCLAHSVSSGPRGRLAHVCDVCYTLLVRETAPYFSNEVPHTPD